MVRADRSGFMNELDWTYIFRQLTPLCEIKEAPEIPTQLENLRGEVAQSEPL